MAITPRLELRQSQSLVMTQQLQQSIKLLQLSSVELGEFIAEEMERNPLLAVEDADGNAPAPESAEKGDQSSAEQSGDDAPDGDRNAGDSSDYLDSGEGESFGGSDEAYSTNRYEGARQNHAWNGDEGNPLEDMAADGKTLREHLLEQLHVDMLDPVLRMIGAQLVDLVDDSGYLREDLTALSQQFGVSELLMEEALRQLQRFDPPGVFARDLKECLKLQLEDRGHFDPMMEKLIEKLEWMGSGEFEKLRKHCGATAEDFADMLAEIKTLNPKPASHFSQEITQAIQPDVFVRRGKGGKGWTVELNSDALPRVLLNQHYYEELSTRTREKSDKKYLTEQFANANWLVKALHQRATTIMKVASEIVKQQESFLLYGIQFLKPMTLKDVALAIEMHESTISRVTSNKYMHTPRGIFELKYFFNSSISSEEGAQDFSSKTVMHYIRELVDAEEPKAILSDDTIVQMLKDKNINIARRTVTKYREAMNIPASPVRRRLKSHSAVVAP